MISIHSKTSEDLELDQVLMQVFNFSITDLGKQKVLEIKPIISKQELLISLKHTNEYLSSFENDNTIPNHYFEEITEELSSLSIENYFLADH